MENCVRELTAKEIIERSDIDKKDVILLIMKEEDCRTHKLIERHETTISEQRYLIEAYRTVMQDIVYGNWLNKQ